MVVIYKGDDTDFAGLQEIKISIRTALDLSEFRGMFDFLGVERVFGKGELTDKIVTVVYTAEETDGFCLGQNYGTFTLWDERGRKAAVCKILVSVVSHCLCAGMPENAVEICIENAYDYNKLENLPTINGVEVKGVKTGHDYHLQKILPFAPEWTYEKGDQCIYGDVIYLCVRDIPEPKTWDGNDWLCISNGDRSVVTVDELPPTGVPDVIYIVRGTGLIYTWDGESFVALGRNHAPLLFWNGGETEGGSGTSSGESGYDAYDGAEERVIPMSAEGVAGLVKTADSVVSESAQKQGTAATPAAVRKILAPDFDPETRYFCGQAVIYDGKYYICTVMGNDGRQGPWKPNDFREGTVEMAREAGIPDVNKVPVQGQLDGHDLNLANLADLFPAFYAAKEYIRGQWVMHFNKFYRFTKGHAAGTAWDADEVEPFETVADALEAVDAESKARDAELDDRKRDYDDLSYNTKIEVPVWNFSFRTEGEPSYPNDAAVLYFDDTTSIPDVIEVWKGTSARGTETALAVNLQGGDSVIQYGTVSSTRFTLPKGEEHFELRRGLDPTFILTGAKGTGEKIVGEDTIALKSDIDKGLEVKRDKIDLAVYVAGMDGKPVPVPDTLAKASDVALDPIYSTWGITLLPLSQTTQNALFAVDAQFSANGYAYSLKDNFTSFYIGAVKVLDLSEDGMSLRAVSAPLDSRVAEILTWLTKGIEIAAKTVIGYEPHGQGGKQMPDLRARRVIIGDNARVDSGVDNAVDYVAIGKDARIGGNSTMAVGNGSHAGGDNSAAIGPNANAEADNDLVVGGDAAAHGTQALAVGNNAQAQGYATAVGQGAEAATGGTAIGSHAEVNASEGIAIGHDAFATGENAGQIGAGTNDVANSLKYRDTYIVGADGKIPSSSLDRDFREKTDLAIYEPRLFWDVEWEKNGQKETYRLAPVIPAPAPYVSQYLYEGTRDETEFKIRISFRTNGVSVQIYNIRTANQWYTLTPTPNPFADEAGATWGASTTSSGVSHTFRGLGVSALGPTGDTIAKTSEVALKDALKRDKLDLNVYEEEYGNASVIFPDGYSAMNGNETYVAPQGGETIEFFGPVPGVDGDSYWVPENYKDASEFNPEAQSVWCLRGTDYPEAMMFGVGPTYRVDNWDSRAPTVYIIYGTDSGGAASMVRRVEGVRPTEDSLAALSDIPRPSTVIPKMDSGNGSPGGASPYPGQYARADHVHPSDTSKLDAVEGVLSEVYSDDWTITGTMPEGRKYGSGPTWNGTTWVMTLSGPAIIRADGQPSQTAVELTFLNGTLSAARESADTQEFRGYRLGKAYGDNAAKRLQPAGDYALKASPATSGNLAALDTDGNLKDSGTSLDDISQEIQDAIQYAVVVDDKLVPTEGPGTSVIETFQSGVTTWLSAQLPDWSSNANKNTAVFRNRPVNNDYYYNCPELLNRVVMWIGDVNKDEGQTAGYMERSLVFPKSGVYSIDVEYAVGLTYQQANAPRFLVSIGDKTQEVVGTRQIGELQKGHLLFSVQEGSRTIRLTATPGLGASSAAAAVVIASVKVTLVKEIGIEIGDIVAPDASARTGQAADAKATYEQLAVKADETTPVVPPPSLPADCLPVTGTYYGSDFRLSTVQIGDRGTEYYAYGTDAGGNTLYLALFDKTTGKYKSSESGIDALKFNGRAPTVNSWPVLNLLATGGTVVRSAEFTDALGKKVDIANAEVDHKLLVYGDVDDYHKGYPVEIIADHKDGVVTPTIVSDDGHTSKRYTFPVPDWQNGQIVLNGNLALLQNIADGFKASTTYAKDALVVYEGALYRCVNAEGHKGSWLDADFSRATAEDVLAALRAALKGKADKPATFTEGHLAALGANGNPTDSGVTASECLRYDLGTAQTISTASQDTSDTETIDYGAATMADRTGNYVAITTALDELRVTFPAATNGKIRDFLLRVEVGTGSAALTAPALVCVAPTGENITLENPDGSMPAIAAGTATAKGVAVFYFSETAAGKFICKGMEMKEVA